MVIPLPKTLTISGFKLTQVYRKGNVAVYRKVKGDIDEYEVILITIPPGQDARVASIETYPMDMAWGTNGWTYTTLEDAMKKAQAEVYLEETE